MPDDEALVQQTDQGTTNGLVPIYQGQTFVGYVTPMAAALYYQNMNQRGGKGGGGGGGGGSDPAQLLGLAADTGVLIYTIMEMGDLDDNFAKAQDARDQLLALRAAYVTAVSNQNAVAGAALAAYLDQADQVDLYQNRVLDVQLKCLWADAIASGGRALGDVLGSQGILGGSGSATAWIIGGVAAGGFLISTLFERRSSSRGGRTGTGTGTRAGR